jgi:hypothetical protein
VRGLIEEMIDQSRVEEMPPSPETDRPEAAAPAEVGQEDRSLCDDIVGLATLPARMAQAALSRGVSIARRACVVRSPR